MRHRPLLSLLIVVVFSFAGMVAASAHHLPPGMEEVDEFADHASFLVGFNHPLTGLDHLTVAFLTGWLVSRLGGWMRPALIPAALLALAGGAVAARMGFKMPAVEAVLAASVVLSAIVISVRSIHPVRIGAAILVLFEIWHGNTHALESPARSAPVSYLAGVCAATALVMVLGWSLALLARRHLPGTLPGAQPA
jgi:urease accessory protein